MSDAIPTTPLARVGGRRFLVALLTIACAMGARAAGWIDGAQLVHCLEAALGLYGAANVGGRLTSAIAAAATAKQGSAP